MNQWNLRTASFKGVTFTFDDTGDASAHAGVQTTRERIRKRVQVFEFAHVDGAKVDDLGRAPIDMQLRSVWWGAGYMSRWRQFQRLAIDSRGPGTLVHPVHGSIHAQFMEATLETTSDLRNALVAVLRFIEAQRQKHPFQAESAGTVAGAASTASGASAGSAQAEKDAIAVIARAVGLPQIATIAEEANVTEVFGDLLNAAEALGAPLTGVRISEQTLAAIRKGAAAETARQEEIARRNAGGTP